MAVLEVAMSALVLTHLPIILGPQGGVRDDSMPHETVRGAGKRMSLFGEIGLKLAKSSATH